MFLIKVHATLSVDGDLNGVGGKSALFVAVHFSATNFLQHFLGNLLESFSCQDIDALISAKGQIAAGLETGAKCSRERESTFWVELSLVHSNKHSLCLPG
jgi:hypothetical protein